MTFDYQWGFWVLAGYSVFISFLVRWVIHKNRRLVRENRDIRDLYGGRFRRAARAANSECNRRE